MANTVAIHQPNFFPWLGYFDKIARADVFIILDNVQFPKTGGIWTNRAKLLIAGQPHWITAAVDRNYSGKRQIREMQFLAHPNWRSTMLKSIATNYSRHPFYTETMEVIQPLILNKEVNVADYNIQVISTLSNRLGLSVSKLRRSSEFQLEMKSNELLCALTRLAGGSIYLYGGGAAGYQDESIFKQNQITLKPQNFQHPVYVQCAQDSFTAGLSIVDAAMNVGWDGVRELLAVS
jgi:hypothetical protein